MSETIPISARVDLPLAVVEVVSKVEERFVPVHNAAGLGSAKTESKVEPEMSSAGWYAVLSRLGIALRIGAVEPDLRAGDTLLLSVSRMKRKDEIDG